MSKKNKSSKKQIWSGSKKIKATKPKGKETMDTIDDFNGLLLNNYGKTEMSVNGLKATFHMPKAVRRITNPDGTEALAQLPPGAPRPAFTVDEYPACPTGWMHGSANASSYFVPIEAEHGMWLDLNANAYDTHHIAAVVSVQGINPITGLKSDPIRLEQYRKNCPVHNVEFAQDRFCKDCKRKWPAQNYIATTGTPAGYMWLDGFMTEEGVVRQWFFTEEEAKGVAAQLIKQERVFAIGIALYKSKNPKPVQPVNIMRHYSFGGPINCASPYYGANLGSKGSSLGPVSWNSTVSNYVDDGHYTSTSNSVASTSNSSEILGGDSAVDFAPSGKEVKTSGGIPLPDGERRHISGRRYRGPSVRGSAGRDYARIEKQAKKIEVGAGARIDQKIYQDPENLDFWEETPAGFIYINYTDVATCKAILAAGKREESKEGFLDGVKLAN